MHIEHTGPCEKENTLKRNDTEISRNAIGMWNDFYKNECRGYCINCFGHKCEYESFFRVEKYKIKMIKSDRSPPDILKIQDYTKY